MWNTIYNTLRSRGLKSTRETDHARNLAFLPDSGMIPPPPEVSPRAGRRRPREAVPPPRPFRSPGLSGLRLPATAPTAWPAAPPLPVPRTLQAPFPGNGPNSRSSRHAGRSRPKGAVLAAPAVRRSPRPLRLAGRTPAQPPQAPSGAGLQRRRKVFHKLRLWVSETEIQKVVANTPGAIEPILLALREKVKDGAVQQAPPPTADPGPSSADANSPQAQLTTPAHTGLQGPTVPSGVKTLPSQRTPERTGHCWVFAFQSGPSRWVPGAPGFRAATVTGGKGAGPGRAAGDGQGTVTWVPLNAQTPPRKRRGCLPF
ncbi:nascent polypeptide-associated complex subunit alpha, muscle-specific form-like isoform X7 [Ursus americanus]|uniref:nascent polypeptide-associated complex subunit alpha, muscle-specific form-like isoform X7 n=1 Tax=Ursus americanus TaxID=9643 RepID=UPI001E679FD4|nr:nascent polypeptide-associated complex subunit alpha, muscle-specific form-like isoform X7 [Ursus americanus]